MYRRFAVVLPVALALFATACGGHSRPTVARNASSRPIASGGTTTTSAGSSPGAASAPSSTVAQPASHGGGSRASAAPAPGAAATDAKAALDTYLTGVARLDPAVVPDSTGAAAALAQLRLVVASVNQSQGGTTTVELNGESFEPTSADASHAVFGGTVQLASTVSGSKGTTTSTDTITGPVQVVRDGANWHVSTFTYDDHPLQVVPEQVTGEDQGLRLSVDDVLSYGTATTAVVGLDAESGHSVAQLRGAALTTSAGRDANGHGAFTTDAHPVGLITWPRTDARPVRLEATFEQLGGPTATISVVLPGVPS